MGTISQEKLDSMINKIKTISSIITEDTIIQAFSDHKILLSDKTSQDIKSLAEWLNKCLNHTENTKINPLFIDTNLKDLIHNFLANEIIQPVPMEQLKLIKETLIRNKNLTIWFIKNILTDKNILFYKDRYSLKELVDGLDESDNVSEKETLIDDFLHDAIYIDDTTFPLTDYRIDSFKVLNNITITKEYIWFCNTSMMSSSDIRPYPPSNITHIYKLLWALKKSYTIEWDRSYPIHNFGGHKLFFPMDCPSFSIWPGSKYDGEESQWENSSFPKKKEIVSEEYKRYQLKTELNYMDNEKLLGLFQWFADSMGINRRITFADIEMLNNTVDNNNPPIDHDLWDIRFWFNMVTSRVFGSWWYRGSIPYNITDDSLKNILESEESIWYYGKWWVRANNIHYHFFMG